MSVSAKITYCCNGCDAREEVEVERLDSHFEGIHGGSSGFGHWVNQVLDAEELAPDGWMAWDPYTRCCYCPSCVESIWPEPEERVGLGFRIVVGGSQ